MKFDWQLTKLLQKLSGLLFLAHPVDYACIPYILRNYNHRPTFCCR